MNAKQNIMNVAVVGCGAISDIYLENMIHRFDNLNVIACCANHPEHAKEKAEKSVRTIELREQDANENTTLNRVFNEIKESYRPEILNTVISVDSVKQEEKNKKEDKKYLTQNLSKYNKREQKLISKVYSILQAILPKDMADMVVAKIQEELSK